MTNLKIILNHLPLTNPKFLNPTPARARPFTLTKNLSSILNRVRFVTQLSFSRAITVILFLGTIGTSGCTSLLYAPTRGLYVNPHQMKLNFEEIEFHSDGNVVNGWYFHQKKFAEPRAVILFFHGNGQNRSSNFFALNWVLDQGFDFMIFDYQGYGESDGKPSPEATLHDGVAAIQYIESQMAKSTHPDVPLIIFAQSLGGAVAMRTLEDYSTLAQQPLPANIRLLILDSTFLSYRRAAASVLSKHWVTFLFQPLSLLVSDSLAPINGLERLPHLPVVVLHGNQDELIDLKLGEDVYEAFSPPKKWILVQGGHHIEAMVEKSDEYRNQVLREMLGVLPRIPLR
jgi:alpha-beta hydrolase superfamily lysophospholipase